MLIGIFITSLVSILLFTGLVTVFAIFIQHTLQHLGTLAQRLVDLVLQVLQESAPSPQLDRPGTPVFGCDPFEGGRWEEDEDAVFEEL